MKVKIKSMKCLLALAVLAGTIGSFAIAEEIPVSTEENIKPAVAADSGIKEESNGKIIPVQDLKGTIQEQKITEEKPEDSNFKAWLNGDYATGEWRGLRTKLEEKGVTLEFTQYNDSFLKARGGIERKARAKSLSLLDMIATFDTEKMGLWKGGKFGVWGQVVYGKSVTESSIGDIQLLSSIDSNEMTRLSEYWYEQRILDDKLGIKLGKWDANGDFCALESTADYINSSFTLIPNIALPTYPEQGLGVIGILEPTEWLSMKAGVFDGEPTGKGMGFKTAFDDNGGLTTLAEIAFKPTVKEMPGIYQLGFWHNTVDAEEITTDLNPKMFSTSYGLYTQFEQMVYKEKDDAEQGLRLIGQFGWAPQDRSEISRYYGMGVNYRGLLPKRENDVTGIGANIAQLSGRLKNVDGRTREAALEVFHKIQLNNWLAIQPDFQVIFNPNGENRDAIVFGVRSIISF